MEETNQLRPVPVTIPWTRVTRVITYEGPPEEVRLSMERNVRDGVYHWHPGMVTISSQVESLRKLEDARLMNEL